MNPALGESILDFTLSSSVPVWAASCSYRTRAHPTGAGAQKQL